MFSGINAFNPFSDQFSNNCIIDSLLAVARLSCSNFSWTNNLTVAAMPDYLPFFIVGNELNIAVKTVIYCCEIIVY